jgi:hypothetical protein
LGKSNKDLGVSPSKVKLEVKEIPEERKKKTSKKDEKKMNEFMKIYGL